MAYSTNITQYVGQGSLTSGTCLIDLLAQFWPWWPEMTEGGGS